MAEARPVVLLGVPSDAGSSFLRGAARAPPAIRAALFSPASNLTAECGRDLGVPGVIRDAGDLVLDNGPGDHTAIALAAEQTARTSHPLFLGGDHAITWPLLRGVVQARGEPLHVVHIDAHPDLYPDFEGDPLSHASPFARILENGLARSLHQIGVRTINAVQQAQIDRYRVTVVPPLASALAAWRGPRGPTWLSIDLDGLDPAFAPGVSHPEPGGLTTRQVLDIVETLPGPLVGADIVEYNPDRDVNGLTAAVCAKLVKAVAARMLRDAAF